MIDRNVMRELPEFQWSINHVCWILASLSASLFSLTTLHYANTQFTTQGRFVLISILLCILTFFFYDIAEKDVSELVGRLDVAMTSVILFLFTLAIGYFYVEYNAILNRVLQYTQLEYLLAAIVILVAIEGTRRSYGVVLSLLILSTIFYAHFGPFLPSVFNHSGVGVYRILEMNLLTLDGAFGFIPQIGATWVAIFIVYGGLLDGYGARKFFSALGESISKRVESGVSLFAIVTSSFMGMVTGVAAANTATTGSFTIPLMKENGIRPTTAGAIESVASTGGQLMPPIMGVAAFIMASILNIPYVEVIRAALLPAILFYTSLIVVVHIESINQGIDSNTTVEMEYDFSVGVPIIISFVVLLYYIAYLRYGPLQSGFFAVASLVMTKYAWELLIGDNRRASIKATTRDTVKGMHIGGMIMAKLMPAIVGVAVMVEMIQVGSLVQDISFAMLDASAGQLLLLLTLAMILSIILGMGAPTVVAYIIVAIMVGPAVTEFGVNQLHGHLFVLYFAVLSGITPPFAVACLVASGISGAKFLRTCIEAMKLAAPIYVLPFAFVIHDNLILWNQTTVVSFLIVFVGLVGIIIGTVGYPRKQLSALTRIASIAGASLIIFTNVTLLNAVGVSLVLCILLYLRTDLRVPSVSPLSS